MTHPNFGKNDIDLNLRMNFAKNDPKVAKAEIVECIKKIGDAYSPTGGANGGPGNCRYFYFTNEVMVGFCQTLMERNGVPVKKHKSGLDSVSVLRIPLSVLEKLPKDAADFVNDICHNVQNKPHTAQEKSNPAMIMKRQKGME